MSPEATICCMSEGCDFKVIGNISDPEKDSVIIQPISWDIRQHHSDTRPNELDHRHMHFLACFEDGRVQNVEVTGCRVMFDFS